MKKTTKNNKKFVVVRTYSAGVHAGYLKSRKGMEVELTDSIRIWKWEGAFTLSQLAMEGVTKPNDCRFSMPVDSILLIQAIEIIPTTPQAQKSIQGVKPHKV
jgi:hypothetical protein